MLWLKTPQKAGKTIKSAAFRKSRSRRTQENSVGIRLDFYKLRIRFSLKIVQINSVVRIQQIALRGIVGENVCDGIPYGSLEQITAVFHEDFFIDAFLENGRESDTEFAEFPIMGDQLIVEVIPVKASAAKRVDITFRRVFVSVIDARNSGQRILKKCGHF